MEPQTKLSVLSENSSEWPSITKEARTPSLESEEPVSERPSIFRARSLSQDYDDDMFTLKRANPVYDSEDEDLFASPAKRQRTCEPTVLDWGKRLEEDETHGFNLSL